MPALVLSSTRSRNRRWRIHTRVLRPANQVCSITQLSRSPNLAATRPVWESSFACFSCSISSCRGLLAGEPSCLRQTAKRRPYSGQGNSRRWQPTSKLWCLVLRARKRWGKGYGDFGKGMFGGRCREPLDAQRLECLLFSGYDPYFEGDEPPGL